MEKKDGQIAPSTINVAVAINPKAEKARVLISFVEFECILFIQP